MLLRFIAKHYPTTRYEFFEDDRNQNDSGNGNVAGLSRKRRRPQKNYREIPVADAESKRSAMIDWADALELPPAALDWLIDQLGGTRKVAEMTGRRIRQVSGKLIF